MPGEDAERARDSMLITPNPWLTTLAVAELFRAVEAGMVRHPPAYLAFRVIQRTVYR